MDVLQHKQRNKYVWNKYLIKTFTANWKLTPGRTPGIAFHVWPSALSGHATQRL